MRLRPAPATMSWFAAQDSRAPYLSAVSRWLDIPERLYAIVRLPPFGAPRVRAIRKSQKHYHYDWVQVYDITARFENLVPMHLLKWVHREQDLRGRDVELRYFRDVDRREADFVLTDRSGPTHLIEVTWSDRPVDKALCYLHARFPDAAAIQINASGTDDYRTPDGIRVQPALLFLQSLVLRPPDLQPPEIPRHQYFRRPAHPQATTRIAGPSPNSRSCLPTSRKPNLQRPFDVRVLDGGFPNDLTGAVAEH